jgi:hypothetical protein
MYYLKIWREIVMDSRPGCLRREPERAGFTTEAQRKK